jgi:hypothetical protein
VFCQPPSSLRFEQPPPSAVLNATETHCFRPAAQQLAFISSALVCGG